MTVANLLRQTVDQVNTPFSDEGSAKYYRLLNQLGEELGVENPQDFDEVYDGDTVIGFDIDGVRITVNR